MLWPLAIGREEIVRALKFGALLAVIETLFFSIAARGQAISPDALTHAYRTK